jgi:hypothetical protein
MVCELVDRRLASLADFSVFLDELALDEDFGGTPAVAAIVRQYHAEYSECLETEAKLHVGFMIGVELGRRIGDAR